nr:twin-arginine translocase TatA/TatE family subunit [Streptomyces sp. BHT-5-2]
MFDLSLVKLLCTALLAVLLFGPDKLPEFTQNVTGCLRQVREYSDSAKGEIRSELGPQFKVFEFEDLIRRRSCANTSWRATAWDSMRFAAPLI